MGSLSRVAASVCASAAIATCLLLGGWLGLVYVGCLLLAALPGLRAGFALFGRRHPAGWIAGLALGYALTTLAWWAAIVLGSPGLTGLVASWVALGASVWAVTSRLSSPIVDLPAWSRRHTLALCLTLLLVPLLVVRPFARIGHSDAEGNRRYRAYFTADFVWHMALTAELARHDVQPKNPFMASKPLHYYWTYFRIPATLGRATGSDVQTALKLNATATACLFLTAIYLAAWAAFPTRPFLTAAAVAFTVLAPSAEGLAAVAELVRQGQPLSELRNLNIDAVASWAFKGVRIDNLPRAMWYNPQHSFSCALGLLAVPIALHVSRASMAIGLAAGSLLGASVAFNPLLGASFCAVFGATALLTSLARGFRVVDLLGYFWAVAVVGAALGWCLITEMGDGAGASLVVGWWGSARNATALNLLLQLGPILVLAGVGLGTARRVAYASLWPALAGAVGGLLLMHLLALEHSPAWVGFRGGQVFLVMVPPLVACGMAWLWDPARGMLGRLALVAVVVGGLPTSLIDVYNAQDTANRQSSPGGEFPWTIVVTRAEQEALNWVRAATPADAVVQADPIARARDTWSYIPTFAQRRMATGLPISLLPEPDADALNERVRGVYADGDPARAWEETRALHIDYLYVGGVERRAYPAVAGLRARPDLFQHVFGNGEADVYAVRP